MADTATRWRTSAVEPTRPYPAPEQRRGDWMLTATGRQYWPLDPHPADVCLTDIAASLAKQCRFAGHVRTHYSVAEHSVLVSQVVPREHALQALMHDATEAYCVDIPRPLKRGLGSVYADIEELNWLAICEHFNIESQMHPCVKRADDAVLMAERDALCAQSGPKWSVDAEPADVVINGFDWPLAQFMFLRRFRELTRAV